MAEEKKYKIFLVDDDQFLLNMYSIKFSNAGFQVETAVGGSDALAKLRGDADPDAVLLDVVMPGMDGIELLEVIKKEKLAPHASFIILSNQGQAADIERAKKIGIAGYIVKATSIPSEVVSEIQAILKQAHK
jgi:CheY-like chemotaxis protein